MPLAHANIISYVKREITVITLRLPLDVEEKLEKLAKKHGQSKTHYARQAILDLLQDEDDLKIALSRMKKGRPTISLEEAERRLGLKS